MAHVSLGDKVAGDRLASLTAASAAVSEVVVRTMRAFWYELQGKKGKFHIFAVMVLDANGDMVHLTENIFGTDAQRIQIMNQRKQFWMPEGKTSLFRLKNIKKVQRQQPTHLSCTVPQCLVIEKFGSPQASVKALPIMSGGIEDKVLPLYYLPRRVLLSELEDVQEGLFVTLCGMVTSVSSRQDTSKGPVRNLTIHDGAAVLEGIKIWRENGEKDLDAVLRPQESIVVLCNYWVGASPGGTDLLKVVNVPERSKIQVLQRSELVADDQKWFDELKKTQPTKKLILAGEGGSQENKKRRAMAEWAGDQGEQASASMLSLLSKPLPDEEPDDSHRRAVLYRLDGIFPEVDLAVDWKSKSGDVFTQMILTDASGQVKCRCPEDPLLALCGLPAGATEELKRQLEAGHLLLRRGSVYIQRAVHSDRDDPSQLRVSLVMRAARVQWFPQEPLPKHLLMHTCGLYPATLSQVKKAGLGGLRVDGIPTKKPLVLLEGSQYPPRSKVDESREHWMPVPWEGEGGSECRGG
ncbi:unnamed protein product [Effrenium voratum]|nr:unnamed protein product [Effrenium voratum]